MRAFSLGVHEATATLAIALLFESEGDEPIRVSGKRYVAQGILGALSTAIVAAVGCALTARFGDPPPSPWLALSIIGPDPFWAVVGLGFVMGLLACFGLLPLSLAVLFSVVATVCAANAGFGERPDSPFVGLYGIQPDPFWALMGLGLGMGVGASVGSLRRSFALVFFGGLFGGAGMALTYPTYHISLLDAVLRWVLVGGFAGGVMGVGRALLIRHSELAKHASPVDRKTVGGVATATLQ